MRPWVLRLAAIALLIGLPPAVGADRAFACSCIEPSPPLEAMEEAATVFAGTVVAARSRGTGGKLYEFEVSRVWKGLPSAKKEVVTDADCGYFFKEGEEYLVYAYPWGRVFETNSCTRTTRMDRASDDLSALGEWRAPEPARGPYRPPVQEGEGTPLRGHSSPLSDWAIGLLAAASVAVVVTGVVAIRRHARQT